MSDRIVFQARLSEEDKTAFRQRAQKAGLNLSNYFRVRCIGKEVREKGPPPPDFDKRVRELLKVMPLAEARAKALEELDTGGERDAPHR